MRSENQVDNAVCQRYGHPLVLLRSLKSHVSVAVITAPRAIYGSGNGHSAAELLTSSGDVEGVQPENLHVVLVCLRDDIHSFGRGIDCRSADDSNLNENV